MPFGKKYSISNVVYLVFGRGLRHTSQLTASVRGQTPQLNNYWSKSPDISLQKKLYTIPNYSKKVFQETGIEINDAS